MVIKNGDWLTEPEAIKYRWIVYIERLYNAQNKPVSIELEDESRVDGDALGPGLITSEIGKTMKRLGRKKAKRWNGIPAEFLHTLRGEPFYKAV